MNKEGVDKKGENTEEEKNDRVLRGFRKQVNNPFMISYDK